MKTNACKICQNSIMNEGICLGLAKNSDYSQFVPINMHSPLLEDWIIGNSVHKAIIENDNCNCKKFIKI